jgi:hypothetical protein
MLPESKTHGGDSMKTKIQKLQLSKETVKNLKVQTNLKAGQKPRGGSGSNCGTGCDNPSGG